MKYTTRKGFFNCLKFQILGEPNKNRRGLHVAKASIDAILTTYIEQRAQIFAPKIR